MTNILIASGPGVTGFVEAVGKTSGSDTTVLELDVTDKVVIPFAPDIPVGKLIRLNMGLMDFSLRAIPGVHLRRPSIYTVLNGVGTLRIFIYTNPLPLIPIAVPTLILAVLVGLSLLGVGIALSWRIFKSEEPPGGSLLWIVGLGVLGVVGYGLASKRIR